MKIYAMCVVKNEVDIIQYSLSRALEWADKVIVYDNGSNDETWQKVKGMSNSKIIAFKQDEQPYSDGLRADIFNAFRTELNDGDWWVIQDGDEVYEQSPREFIKSQKGYFHYINGKKIDFSFDLNRIQEIPFSGEFEKDLHLFNFYTPEIWSEHRAIRHRNRLKWNVKNVWPTTMGLVCNQTIPIRHYPLRSPDQIRKRWSTRKDIREKSGWSVEHWAKGDWKDYYARKSKTLKPVESIGEVFGNTPFMNDYRQGFLKRWVKKTLHYSGLLPALLMTLA